MRIMTHPDKLKKPGMTDAEQAQIDARAARVGQAVDLLKDPRKVSATTLPLEKSTDLFFYSVWIMIWKWAFDSIVTWLVCVLVTARW